MSSVVDDLAEADRRPVALRAAEVVLDEAGRAAEEHRQHAGGERVERPAVAHAPRGREPAHEPDDVVGRGPGRLGDDEHAVEPAAAVPRAHRRTSAARRSATSRRAGTASSSGTRDRRPGRPGVPAAAEGPGQHGRVHAARPRADGQARRAVLLLLEEHRDLRRLGLGEQVDDPLGVRRDRAGLVEVGQAQRGPDHPAVGRRLEPVQHAPEQAQLRVRLGPVEAARDVGQRRPGLHERRRDGQRARASRWGGRRSPCP